MLGLPQRRWILTTNLPGSLRATCSSLAPGEGKSTETIWLRFTEKLFTKGIQSHPVLVAQTLYKMKGCLAAHG